MEKGGYVNIQEWMLEFDLSANELIAFAIIYGFSQDGRSAYLGGYGYLKKWLNVTSNHTISAILQKLIKMGLIVCKESRNGAIKTCEYRISLRVQKMHPHECKKYIGTSAKTAPDTSAKNAHRNISVDNKTRNKEEKEEKEESPQHVPSIFDSFQKIYGN